MKSTIVIFIAFIVLTSCSGTDVNVSETNSQGKWELVKMSGRTLNSETSGAAMEWQEFYLLNDNSTFTKSRTRDGNTSRSTGTYKITISGTETYFDVLVSTWQNCDGPRLEYRKTK